MVESSIQQLAFQESPSPQIVTEHRRIKCSNRSFNLLFGLPSEELIGDFTLKLYLNQQDYISIGDRALSELQGNTTYEDRRFMRHRSGGVFRVRARGITLTPQDPYAFMIWNFEQVASQPNDITLLTLREQEVVSLIAEGLTCKEAARQLGISHRTVEVHRSRIMKKLDARNTADLVAKVMASQQLKAY